MFKQSLFNKILLAVLLFTVSGSFVHSASTREYQLKAAYMLNFARFVYWPEDIFKSSSNEFIICIYGKSPFGESLNKLSKKKIKNKNISLRYVSVKGVGEGTAKSVLSECHVLYVSNSTENQYAKILKQISQNTVLTVSDINGFCESGGMIGFIRVKNKIKFEINLNASSRAGIKYQSQLLDVAEQLR